MVADALLQHYAKGTRGIPAVDGTSWNALRGRIMLDPTYISGPAGLVSAMFGGSEYPHDG